MRTKRAPIEVREAKLKAGADIWNTKMGAGEIDAYKPRRETLAQWIGEVERQMGPLRLHPAWGRACQDLGRVYVGPSPFAPEQVALREAA